MTIMAEIHVNRFADWLINWGTKLKRCQENNCPVADSGKPCTLYHIAQTTGIDPLRIAKGDFYWTGPVRRFVLSRHCLALVRRCSDWENAEYDTKTGKIENNNKLNKVSF